MRSARWARHELQVGSRSRDLHDDVGLRDAYQAHGPELYRFARRACATTVLLATPSRRLFCGPGVRPIVMILRSEVCECGCSRTPATSSSTRSAARRPALS
jgi:hypothetical protein